MYVLIQKSIVFYRLVTEFNYIKPPLYLHYGKLSNFFVSLIGIDRVVRGKDALIILKQELQCCNNFLGNRKPKRQCCPKCSEDSSETAETCSETSGKLSIKEPELMILFIYFSRLFVLYLLLHVYMYLLWAL